MPCFVVVEQRGPTHSSLVRFDDGAIRRRCLDAEDARRQFEQWAGTAAAFARAEAGADDVAEVFHLQAGGCSYLLILYPD